MRTTITIDDRLLDALKQRAREEGTSVSRLIEDSVRLAVAAPVPDQDDDFELVTFGRGEGFTPQDTDKTAKLLERDDLERYGYR
jgi:hypothetical protein